MIPDGARPEFFISYTSADRVWAEWVAWQLEEAGHGTVLQAWDFGPGSNFVVDMHLASARAERTLIILSPDYLQSAYALSEWAAAFAGDPAGSSAKLVPIRVAPCQPDGILGQVVYIDLVGLDEMAARTTLLARVRQERGKPSRAPGFPGAPVPAAEAARPFPGEASHRIGDPSEQNRRRRFVHAKVSAHGLLDLTPSADPYGVSHDATDSHDRPRPSGVFAFCWFPTSQYLRSSPLQPFTPAAAICVTNPLVTTARLTAALEVRALTESDVSPAANGAVRINSQATTDLPPSRMRNEEKEHALVAVATALRDSFVAAVTIPDSAIGAGRHRPDMAYQVMSDLFLLPLTEVHRRLGFEQFHVRLGSVGESTGTLLGLTKRVLKAGYPRRGSTSVELVPEERGGPRLLLWAARMVAWAVGSFYNSGNGTWVSILDRGMNVGEE